MRLRAKRDANEGAIVQALEAAGCVVLRVSEAGAPDLVVCHVPTGRVWLIEVKDGAKSPSRQKLKPKQAQFHARWSVALCLHVIRSIDEALALVKGTT